MQRFVSRRRCVRLLAALAFVFVTGAPFAAQSPGTLRIYLARHGETDWNVLRKMQGQTDIPLNSTGRAQALLLRDTLKGIAIDAI
jgi:probable phosphoglycerate mutase